MSFNVNNKQIFTSGIQFTSSSLDSLVKILDEDDFKYLSQKLDRKVLELAERILSQ